MKQLAIIGPTASGKSDLALTLASDHNALILSIDSLSIYKEIDIASAKPSHSELVKIDHFGINCLLPNENASVFSFIDEYSRIFTKALTLQKNIIIVGGSSFYLKSMLEGLSKIPEFSLTTLNTVKSMLMDLKESHKLLSSVDPISMEKISSSDAYRIEKMLLIHIETGCAPSEWFRIHPPTPVIQNCPVFNLNLDRDLLRQRIALRTQKMLSSGLIDEVARLEQHYGRVPNSMKAIGIIETLEYLDGKITKPELIESISIHTSQLAKRQQTFNAHQFVLKANGNSEILYSAAKAFLSQ
ncbi:MAG: tRNA (adenosine(37)-N6)-dimethylallyltransferase MiaA [Sulfuricurvum sp.]|nr:tRNA (adenosine(37)-N6)-dimethylallyltransferase MiaA [Sulfuricurvum sp.]